MWGSSRWSFVAFKGALALARGVGMSSSALDFDDIVHSAQRRAEPDSFVDESYREALTQLLRSAAEHDINPFGRWYLKETIVAHLANGQRIEGAIVDNPTVLDVPIERPVFIVSPFRTGTTLIHRLLGTAPEVRTLRKIELNAAEIPALEQNARSSSRFTCSAPAHLDGYTEIAGRWGFTDFGRLAGEYRQLFGELPRATLMSDQGQSSRHVVRVAQGDVGRGRHVFPNPDTLCELGGSVTHFG